MTAQNAADLRAAADRLAMASHAHDDAAARLLALGAPNHVVQRVIEKADRFMDAAFRTDAAADRAEPEL